MCELYLILVAHMKPRVRHYVGNSDITMYYIESDLFKSGKYVYLYIK